MKSLEVQYFSCSPHLTFLRSFLFSFAYPKQKTSLSRKSKNISPQNQKFIIQSYLPKNESSKKKIKMKSDLSLSFLEVCLIRWKPVEEREKLWYSICDFVRENVVLERLDSNFISRKCKKSKPRKSDFQFWIWIKNNACMRNLSAWMHL